MPMHDPHEELERKFTNANGSISPPGYKEIEDWGKSKGYTPAQFDQALKRGTWLKSKSGSVKRHLSAHYRKMYFEPLVTNLKSMRKITRQMERSVARYERATRPTKRSRRSRK